MSARGSNRSRREARERALELLYEARSKEEPVADVIASLPVAPAEYAVTLATGVERKHTELDMYIREHVRGWTIDRLPMIDRAVLQLAIYELQYQREVPAAVVINEAVDLAKQFSTEESGRFVNGMLSALGRSLRGRELAERDKAGNGDDEEGPGNEDAEAADRVDPADPAS